jgi:hypothetical protein
VLGGQRKREVSKLSEASYQIPVLPPRPSLLLAAAETRAFVEIMASPQPRRFSTWLRPVEMSIRCSSCQASPLTTARPSCSVDSFAGSATAPTVGDWGEISVTKRSVSSSFTGSNSFTRTPVSA